MHSVNHHPTFLKSFLEYHLPLGIKAMLWAEKEKEEEEEEEEEEEDINIYTLKINNIITTILPSKINLIYQWKTLNDCGHLAVMELVPVVSVILLYVIVVTTLKGLGINQNSKKLSDNLQN
ncbi:hypothetical protein QTP88_025817 [Uroleucon formosanum]